MAVVSLWVLGPAEKLKTLNLAPRDGIGYQKDLTN